jgi:hypothetical protein
MDAAKKDRPLMGPVVEASFLPFYSLPKRATTRPYQNIPGTS